MPSFTSLSSRAKAAPDAPFEFFAGNELQLCLRIVKIENVEGFQVQVGSATVHLVRQEIGRHGVHTAHHVTRPQPFGDRAGSQEAGLRRHHDFVPLQLA